MNSHLKKNDSVDKIPKLLVFLASIFHEDNKYWPAFLAFLSIFTCIIVWLNFGEMFTDHSVIEIWQARHHPQSVFQYIIKPFAYFGDLGIIIFLTLLNTLFFLLFDYLAKIVGVGKKTFFVLFLLLNFSPELNKLRLNVDSYSLAIILWLCAMIWFIKHYLSSFYLAFAGWAVLMWIAGLFSVNALLWALFFPLSFIFWPSSVGKWWQGIKDRLKFISLYYLVIIIVILIIPYFRNNLWEIFNDFGPQSEAVIDDFSIFIGGNNGVNLSLFNSLLIALALIAFNVLSIANILMIVVLYLSIKHHQNSIYTGRVKLFFIFCLGFSWLIHAISLLYQGHFQESNHYLASIIILLFLSSTGAYYVVQKIMNGRFSSQYILIMTWLLIAFAIASMFKFGPTLHYKKEAGLWISTHNVSGEVYSNSPVVLYYANRDPEKRDRSMVGTMRLAARTHQLKKGDYFILVQGIKTPIPGGLEDYQIVETFSNNSNYLAYIMTLNPDYEE